MEVQRILLTIFLRVNDGMSDDDVKNTLINERRELKKLQMILNLIIFSLLALGALILIQNIYLSYFAAGICLYVGVAGIVLTIVGAKRTNIKEDIAIRIEKRGVLA